MTFCDIPAVIEASFQTDVGGGEKDSQIQKLKQFLDVFSVRCHFFKTFLLFEFYFHFLIILQFSKIKMKLNFLVFVKLSPCSAVDSASDF